VRWIASPADVDILASEMRYHVGILDGTCPGIDLDASLRKVLLYADSALVCLPAGDSATIRKLVMLGAADVLETDDPPAVVEAVRKISPRQFPRNRAAFETSREEGAYEAMLDALLCALDWRDAEPDGHVERVTAYAILIAEEMGLPPEEISQIERGALLHDIGLIGVPEYILAKNGPLTEEEHEDLRAHTRIGYNLCSRIAMLSGAAQIVLHHHERWDGTGYPDRLEGEDIPLGCRVFAVADALDAMTSARPHRQPLSWEKAAQEIVRGGGTQFDPEVVRAFQRVPRETWASVRDSISEEQMPRGAAA
jgi:HD-GYP domain-containing protein (c-di-GMP phosphodiesterase class II)